MLPSATPHCGPGLPRTCAVASPTIVRTSRRLPTSRRIRLASVHAAHGVLDGRAALLSGVEIRGQEQESVSVTHPMGEVSIREWGPLAHHAGTAFLGTPRARADHAASLLVIWNLRGRGRQGGLRLARPETSPTEIVDECGSLHSP